MRTWKDILVDLAENLDLERVKTRVQGGEAVPYLEGDDVINTLNRIFGFDGWSSMMVSGIQSLLVGTRVKKDVKDPIPLTMYLATYQMEFWGLDPDGTPRCIRKADIGKNTAESTAPQMHEMAASGCVTDALKRACRQLGQQFGITLYDKSHPDFKSVQERTSEYPRTTPPAKKAVSPAKKVATPEKTAEKPVEAASKPAKEDKSSPEKVTANIQKALEYIVPLTIEAGGSNLPVPFSGKKLADAVKSPVGYSLVAWLGGLEKSPAGLEPWVAATDEQKQFSSACKYLAEHWNEVPIKATPPGK